MKLKKKLLVTSTAVVLSTAMFASSAFAVTVIDYWGDSQSSFAPDNGSFNVTFYTSSIETRAKFSFTSSQITSIKDYNDGGANPGDLCDNKNAYLNLDMTAIPDNPFDLEVSAYAQSTNMPNPKYDLETDGGVDNQESDVTALGTLVAGTAYYAYTDWHDYRDGDDGDSGSFEANFDMSALGFSDYNVCQPSDGPQGVVSYGDDLGEM